jgi:Serine/threonine protein kinase
MDSSPFFAYSFLSPLYNENIYAYHPSDEFLDIVRAALDDTWRIRGKGFWASCSPVSREDLEHGWKIHVSSMQHAAAETLAIVTGVLKPANIAFKFCSDRRMLRMSLGKGWSRFQIGKFMTIYPKDVDEFRDIIEKLHVATAHLTGPFILTDRPYKDSTVVYYRYGVHRGMPRVDATGRKVSGFYLEDGSWFTDVRGPTFRLPPGMSDPLLPPVAPVAAPSGTPAASIEPPKAVVLKDRYVVQGALKFNATGGIYRGIDNTTGREIIIREVRGKLGPLEKESLDDPAFILRREARILETLSPTGLVPEYIDLFQEWDHWFLVVEKLDAISLWGHSMEFYFANEHQDVEFGLDRILASIREIALGLQAIHARGIVLRDLTRNNILFSKQGDKVKFIDFEFAFELDDTTSWIAAWTPGYASKAQATAQRPSIADDCYALGVLILDMLTFCSPGLELGRESIFRKLELNLKDMGLPMDLMVLVHGLAHEDEAQRWSVERALAYLDTIELPRIGRDMFPSREAMLEAEPPTPSLLTRIDDTLVGMRAFVHQQMAVDREDRLWPATAEVFTTHPASLEYGATGTACFLARSKGGVPQAALAWILRKEASVLCPPGLYSGRSGIAWLMLATGQTETACRMMDAVAVDPLVYERPGLYYGCAGVGLAHLHAWAATGDARHLDRADAIGMWLIEHAVRSERGLSWVTGDKVFLGYGEGQSGIATFLTFLAAATGSQRYAEAAGKALDFDISHARRVSGRLVWKIHTASPEQGSNLPHVKFGSAGVGGACIRFYALTGDVRYRDVALDCAHTVRMRMSNKIWQEEGAAGFGEFMLDLATFLDEPRFRNIAFYQAEAILAHALERPEGVAFGGVDHYRICADFSYGIGGIGIFFERLMRGTGRFLMLDSLLTERASRREAERAQEAVAP